MLQRGEIFHKHFAQQVVELVLDADGQKAVGFEGEFFAFFVAGFHGYALGAGDGVVNAGHRQAAFFVGGFAVFMGDHGVDKHARLVVFFGEIHHHHALVHVHLGGGQADAVRGIHGFQHIGHQRLNALINLRHGFGHGVQALIGIFKDVE